MPDLETEIDAATRTRPPHVRIDGWDVHDLSFEEAVDRVLDLSEDSNPSVVVTPNVDHLMLLRRDEEFREAYRRADLRLADGMPLLWAARLQGRPLKAKVSGSDLFLALCVGAARRGRKVFFLGGQRGAAEEAVSRLRVEVPDLQVCGTCCPEPGFEVDETASVRVVEEVRRAAPDVLFLFLGAPKQEVWGQRHRHELGVPVSVHCGAALDFYAGFRRRAPRLMQRTGFEWLFRLCQEPGRMAGRYMVRDLPFVLLLLRLAFLRGLACLTPAPDRSEKGPV